MSELSRFSLETLKVAYVSLMIRLHSPLDWTERLLGDHDGTILGVAVRCFWRLLSCGTTDGQSVLDVDSRLGLRQRRVKRSQPDTRFLVSRCILPLEQSMAPESSFFSLQHRLGPATLGSSGPLGSCWYCIIGPEASINPDWVTTEFSGAGVHCGAVWLLTV